MKGNGENCVRIVCVYAVRFPFLGFWLPPWERARKTKRKREGEGEGDGDGGGERKPIRPRHLSIATLFQCHSYFPTLPFSIVFYFL